MTGLDIHSASPLSSKSSNESISKDADAMDTTSAPNVDTMGDAPPVLDNEAKSNQLSQPLSGHQADRRPSRTMPRLDTRKSSITTPLPWKIDETSSPSTTTSHTRKASAPPMSSAGYRASIGTNDASPRNKFQPLSATAGSSTPSTYAPSSPYTNSSSSHLLSSRTSHATIDLSHPPGYMQHSTPFTDHVPSDSPSYTNHSPFYSNSSYSSNISSTSSPLSPTRRGRGILDNDPSIYLSGEGGGEEGSYWETATKWAKAAGKRLSASEQTIWKMVNSMGTDHRP